uniref:rRNA processing, putative n=1 Tax=Theileria annulata TaxID=5874 RepID=A0A3B0MVI3_THEAN
MAKRVKKVKGYGAYWSGDIKNKHIQRKNKQYVIDQKYLTQYKKISHQNILNSVDSYNTLCKSISFENNNQYNNDNVEIIKPIIETVYLEPSDQQNDEETIHNNGEIYQLDSNSTQNIITNINTTVANPVNTSKSLNLNNHGIYSKIIDKRKRLENKSLDEYNKHIEELKTKKKERRKKKELRYERHRLLGTKTKKGQPIMKNVIKHLMKSLSHT